MKCIWKKCYNNFFAHIFLGAPIPFKRYQNTSGCGTALCFFLLLFSFFAVFISILSKILITDDDDCRVNYDLLFLS